MGLRGSLQRYFVQKSEIADSVKTAVEQEVPLTVLPALMTALPSALAEVIPTMPELKGPKGDPGDSAAIEPDIIDCGTI